MKRLTELSLSTRWLVTLVASGIVAVALPRSLPVEPRVLVVWNVAILAFLGLIVAMLTGKTPEQVRDRTRRDAHGRVRVLAGVIVASLGSLIAVAYIVSDMERHQPGSGSS
jgi:uncharacterized membrane protein